MAPERVKVLPANKDWLAMSSEVGDHYLKEFSDPGGSTVKDWFDAFEVGLIALGFSPTVIRRERDSRTESGILGYHHGDSDGTH